MIRDLHCRLARKIPGFDGGRRRSHCRVVGGILTTCGCLAPFSWILCFCHKFVIVGVDVYLSLDDAIYVYARACRAWYGRKAASNALRAAAECRQRQDFEGERVWTRVSQEVEKVGDPVFGSAFR
jgi:hypothetical protein